MKQKEEVRKNIFVAGAISPELIAKSIASHASKTNIGAHAIFLGQVRADEKGDSKVESIEYSAYEPMALQKAHQIREEIFSRYPISCMHIYHSLGRVFAGQLSLFVFTSSVHRKAALEACHEVVERIKNELPVWGREITGNDEWHWKERT